MINKEILNYRIVSFIGQGGMGCVYLAEHKFVKNQKVAIKVINSDMVNDFTKSQLQEEAEHLAALNHTNIVHFIDYHIDEEGNLYLIMEYADGLSLDKYIETISGLIVEDRICPIFEPILDAVGFAHKHGIIHRDIKPSNIIITTEGIPKILDFGIAKIIKNDNEEEQDHLIMGTPSYMSPEQVKGMKLDSRSDIYSLGVLLHQMLTGNAPYDTTTLTEFDINKKVVEEPLPRMRTFYKYVSDKVQKVVDKATAKDVNKRYQNCEDFKKDLHKAIYPPKFPLWGKVAAVVVALLIVGSGLFWWDYNRIKVLYYRDYVEQWGVPVGIAEISDSERPHVHRMYRMEFTKRKLIRMSHVNSLGVIIGDDESERNDRPLDATFFYNGDGNISRVKVKDHNGKVLYVKSYNENLKTVIFQYDDQYGTEKSLGSQTIGYVHSFTDVSAKKGRISRWLLEYDSEGYVQELRYAGFQNIRVADADNIYGRKFKRDSKGRVIEESYLSIDGLPKPTKWGMGKKVFVYDEHDNWIKSSYLTIDGEPSLDAADGVCVYEMEYDKYGNVVYAYHKNADGSLMLPKMNAIAGVHTVYDDNGFICKQEILGIDGKVAFGQNGWAYCETKCDANGFFNEMHFYDPDGSISLVNEGYSIKKSVNDSKGNEIEAWYYDKNNNLVIANGSFAGSKCEYDSLGNCISVEFYDNERNLYSQPEGNAGYLAEYDGFGQMKKIVFIDKNRKPCALTDSHVICIKYDYDVRGNEIARMFYNAQGDSLRLTNEGIAGWKTEYDDNGNETRSLYIGTDGEPTKTANGYAECRYVYDENGHLKSVRYYDENSNLCINSSEQCAGYNYICDERGNQLEFYKVGRDDKRMPNQLITKYKYDSNDNIVETSYFDGDVPGVNYLNIHKETSSYNNRNQCIETRYYGINGKLTKLGSDKYAIMRNEFDSKGNRVKSYCFGTDEKPVVCSEGWSSSMYEYDTMGNITRQLFFGIDGKPTDPKIMVPEGVCQYDRKGNMTYIASMDGHGNLIDNPSAGWTVQRMTYDANNYCTSRSYFDKEDQPMISKVSGCHKVLYEYDNRGNNLSESYFDTKGDPMKCNGYHMKKSEYDDQGRQIYEAYFDEKDKPILINNYYHKAVYSYEGDSRLASYCKLYNTSGSLLYTLKYNTRTSEWELSSSSTGSSSGSRDSSSDQLKEIVEALSSELPQNLGEDANGMCMYSLRLVSKNTCEMILRTQESKYEMSESELVTYIEFTKAFAEYFKQQIPDKCYVIIVLQDSKERELSRSKK